MTVTAQIFRPPADEVHGTLFLPADVRPVAAVLVIGGSGGSEPSYVAEALAREGMTAMSVAYFARPGLPAQLRGIRLEYFIAALKILRTALPSPAPPVALTGMSRGSEAAMLTAVHAPSAVQGVLATVPGNVLVGSHPPGGPAWLLDGQPLPYAEHSGPRCGNPAALIPAEQIPGPIMLVAAGADRVWPSAAMARALAARLRQHGDPYGHAVLDYPDAGHSLGYLVPRLPDGLLPPGLTDASADQLARADAWPKAVEFLRNLSRKSSVRPVDNSGNVGEG